MEWKVGDLCLFHGRLAELVELQSSRSLPIVEITDEGGNLWSYPVRAYSRFTPLQFEDETVLDAMQRAAAGELTERERLRRLAELWLADPQVGDELFVEDGYILEITDIWDDGVILATHHPHTFDYPMSKVKHCSYDSARQLRKWLALPHGPVYRCLAHTSKRAPLPENHPLSRG
jgi:hypothetical protein